MNPNMYGGKPPLGVVELDDGLDLPVPLDIPLLGNLRVDDGHGNGSASSIPVSSSSRVGHVHDRNAYVNPMSSNWRVDDGHRNAYVNPTSSSLSYHHRFGSITEDYSQKPNVYFQGSDFGASVHLQEPDYTADVLNYLSNVVLEDDVDEKSVMYGTSVDINALSSRINFDPQVRASGSRNVDPGDDMLDYMRHFLLDDDADADVKPGISGSNGVTNLQSYGHSFEGHAQQIASNVNLVSSNLIPEANTCLADKQGVLDFNGDTTKFIYSHSFEDQARDIASSNVHLVSNNLIAEANFSIVNKHDDLDFNDDVLKYINHILLEERVEEKNCGLQESEALEATQKSLYEALWGQYSTSTSDTLQNSGQFQFHATSGYLVSGADSSLPRLDDHREGTSNSSQSISHSSYNSSGSGGAMEATACSPVSSVDLADTCSESQASMHSNEMKEGKHAGKLVVCLSDDEEYQSKHVGDSNVRATSNASTSKKHAHEEVDDVADGRSPKQLAVHTESSIGDDMFDRVLVFRQEKEESAIREEIDAPKVAMQQDKAKGSKGGKRSKKKREAKKNEVDLSNLLTLCAQAVAAEDLRSVNEYLKQIRQHSTPAGDGMQRLAHYFADGLEARMAGAGTQIYTTLINMPISAADLLKAYHIYLAACPHRKTSNFFSNQTILNAAEKASRLHIVDFGTLYGFQWPSFLHKLSLREGGPPSVRFTAIDFPCPGFRPSQRIQETGRRLASYASKFNIPFEFVGLAQNWETITVESLKLDKSEVLVVNCLYRLRYLLDETGIADCPRDIVLKLIRKMNPAIFVLGIRNAGHNVPFFLTRFREALYHYSSIFDALDTVISRDRHERMLLERIIFGREAMNALACEGGERIERPETYKQWQVRLRRAGLEVLPLKREIMATARNKVKLYNKNFVVDEDGYWLLQGWKGRISYALSSWRPAP